MYVLLPDYIAFNQYLVEYIGIILHLSTIVIYNPICVDTASHHIYCIVISMNTITSPDNIKQTDNNRQSARCSIDEILKPSSHIHDLEPRLDKSSVVVRMDVAIGADLIVLRFCTITVRCHYDCISLQYDWPWLHYEPGRFTTTQYDWLRLRHDSATIVHDWGRSSVLTRRVESALIVVQSWRCHARHLLVSWHSLV